MEPCNSEEKAAANGAFSGAERWTMMISFWAYDTLGYQQKLEHFGIKLICPKWTGL